MFELILGVKPDPQAGSLALAVLFLCVCIFTSVFVSNRKSAYDLKLQHDLAVLQANNAHRLGVHQTDRATETERAKTEAKRDVDLAQVQNDSLLVSHQREEQPQS